MSDALDCSQRLLCPWNFPGKNRSGLPFPFPGDLPDPGIEPTAAVSWQWQADSLPLSHGGKPALARIRSCSDRNARKRYTIIKVAAEGNEGERK